VVVAEIPNENGPDPPMIKRTRRGKGRPRLNIWPCQRPPLHKRVNASAISPALVAFSSIGGLLSCAAHHMDIYRSRFPTYETRGGRGMGEHQGPMDLAKLLETNAQAAPHNMFAIDTGEGP